MLTGKGRARPCLPPVVTADIGQPGRRPVTPQEHAARVGGDDLGQPLDGGVGDDDLRPGGVRFESAQQATDRRQRRRPAARRAADQRLPQHQRFGPGVGDAHRRARAAQAGDGCQQSLRAIVDRRAGRTGAVGHPVAPRRRQQLDGKGRHGAAPVVEQAGVDLAPVGRILEGGKVGHDAEPRRLSVGIPKTQHCSGPSSARDG